MPIPEITESHVGSVHCVTLGATQAEGGTRAQTVTVGGAGSVVYAGSAEQVGQKPVIALDVLDYAPADWADPLVEPYRDCMASPADWAAKSVSEYGADLICVKFEGIHPDKGDRDADHAVKVTRAILDAVDVPLILWGCGNAEKDNQVMPKISEAAKGENCLLGIVEQDNYKAITAVALADGHCLITGAPLDINIGKQVNILVSDMGFPTERIITFQTTGALGYGIEYAYSIAERQRLAALSGDKMMSMPTISDVGYESWRIKETKLADAPGWGPIEDRAPYWEATTAICLIQAGADIIRMRHPRAAAVVRDFVNQVW
jgi:acetyl-CoA decarbonylase/synthase complex subunit delta